MNLFNKATDWGWKLVKGNLYPKKMDKLPAPEALMKIMKCGCTLFCESNKCTCKNMAYIVQSYAITVLLETVKMSKKQI